MPLELLRPDWGAPAQVVAAVSTRAGGVSQAPFQHLNLGRGLGDAEVAVTENRRRFEAALGVRAVWLHQVHGAEVAVLDDPAPNAPAVADAAVTARPGLGCTVMVADCLPVLFCAADGLAVGAAHAGWRGLAAGVLERTVQALQRLAGCDAGAIEAWLGPCIGPRHFEVGADVLAAFGAEAADPMPEHFRRRDRADGQPRWLADLPQLARKRLHAAGVQRVGGGRWCTVQESARFFSFRRDGRSGRMAATVAIAA